MRTRIRQYGTALIQLSFLKLVNAYLVVEADGLTLIDTGLASADQPIRRTADQIGLPIVRIVLTHAHLDHVGTLDKLVPALAGPEVLIGAREARLLAGDDSLDAGEPAGRLNSVKPTRTRPTRTLVPGDRVGSLEVHPAPGHTPGQIALLDTRDGTLIAGDAWLTFGQVSTAARPEPPFPFTALGSWHRPTALASAIRLRDLRPARLAAGHGPVIDDPGFAMDAAILRAQ